MLNMPNQMFPMMQPMGGVDY